SGGTKNAPPSPSATAAAGAPASTATPGPGNADSAAAATSAAPASVLPSATAAALATIPPATTPVPQTSSRVETVKLVYDILLDRYLKPLKPDDLLNNAWQGASDAASASVAAPKFNGDRNADWQTFAAAYQQLYSKNGGGPGTTLAFASAKRMISGLHDDHTYFL